MTRSPQLPEVFSLPAGRKPRSSDCAHCTVLKGLREAGLPDGTISALCDHLRLTRAKRRLLLFLEGNRASHLFVLRRGRVKLTKHDASGGEHIVEILQRGDLFGVEAVFGRDCGTSAEALEDVEVCVGGRTEIEALLAAAPSFGISLARYLVERLDGARARQACLGTVGARARLAAWLLHEVGRRGGDSGSIAHDLTLAEYGAVLGTSPETVCRTLGEFKRRGLVKVEGAQLRVLDQAKLRRLART
jgi:CRP-like cAMP-binding protein